MKKTELTVQCIYAKSGTPLAQIAEDAFRLYLIQLLEQSEQTKSCN